MSLTHEELLALLAGLVELPAISAIARRVAAGELPSERVREELSETLSSKGLPEVARLDVLDEPTRKALIGRLSAHLMRATPRATSAAARVLGLDVEARASWRAGLARRAVMPVGLLVEQARRSGEAEATDPQRRDWPWDLVNAGVTALRFCAVVALADYVRGGAIDPQLNRAIVDCVTRPTDGTWSSLLYAPEAGASHALLSVLARRGGAPPCLRVLETSLSGADLPRGVPYGRTAGLPSRPSNVHQLAGLFVSFRNELVHGAYARTRPDDGTLAHLSDLLDVLLATLEPLITRPVVVATSDALLSCNGLAIAEILEAPELPDASPIDEAWREQPVLLDGTVRVPLAPWLTLADLEAAARKLEGEEHALGFSELCFFNKFESELLHFLGFAARAQLVHLELLERRRGEEAYASFAGHLEALRLRAAPPGARKRDPIQRFDALATFHAESFVGRREAISAIARFIDERPAPMGLVSAAPGLGKSALLSHFYRLHGAPDACDGWIFHFAARAEQRDHPTLGLRSLVAQAEQQLARLGPSAKQRQPLPWGYDELSERLGTALTALGEAMAERGRRAVLVLDALDEQTPRPGGLAESIFGALPEEIPPNVVCVVSVRLGPDGRPAGVESGAVSAPRCLPIPGVSPLTGLSEEDVRELVRERLAEVRPELRETSADVLARVCEAARRREEGSLDPFYLRFLADGVRDGTVDLARPGDVPAGLESFFDALWWDLDPAEDFLVHRVLGLLAEMEGFGSDTLFAEVLRRPAHTVARLRHGVNKLLMLAGTDGDEARYGLFHDRFRWYVQGKFSQRDRAIELHAPLLDACRRGVSAADHYAARYTTFHLRALALHPGLDAAQRDAFAAELWHTVHDDRFVARGFDALRDERAMIEDFDRAFDVFRPRRGQPEAEQQRRAAQVTALAERCARTVAGVANLALARVNDFAREGDTMRVLQLAERQPTIALRWMVLTRAAATMRASGLEPTVLFEAIEATDGARLSWVDGATVVRLLEACAAPEGVQAHVRASTDNDWKEVRR
jgi:hypothetical protein